MVHTTITTCFFGKKRQKILNKLYYTSHQPYVHLHGVVYYFLNFYCNFKNLEGNKIINQFFGN
jgi:hypothetical protein